MPYDDPILRELGGYFKAEEPGRRERADAWATAIGLQKVDDLTPSQFLFDTAKDHIEGRITQNQARRRIRDYYADYERGVTRDCGCLETFFRNLLLGEKNEMKSRYLLVGLTDGDKRKIRELAEVKSGKKKVVRKSSLKTTRKSGLKSGLKDLYKTDARLLALIKMDRALTIPKMQEELGMSRNGVKKVLERLKAAGRLRRVGPDKGGHWKVVK